MREDYLTDHPNRQAEIISPTYRTALVAVESGVTGWNGGFVAAAAATGGRNGVGDDLRLFVKLLAAFFVLGGGRHDKKERSDEMGR